MPISLASVLERGRHAARRRIRSVPSMRNLRAVMLFRRFEDLTMVPREQFVENLSVARRARNVPGDLVECGVWRGGMIAALAEAMPGRHCVLFDSFEGLPDARAIDGAAALHWSTVLREHDNCAAEERWAHEAMARARHTDYEVVPGWFSDTIAAYAARGRPIAVLRLDGDWYDSTMVCLEHLLPLVQAGGVVLIDDYFDWDGCSRAVHDHLSRSGVAHRLRTSRHEEFAYLVIPATDQ